MPTNVKARNTRAQPSKVLHGAISKSSLTALPKARPNLEKKITSWITHNAKHDIFHSYLRKADEMPSSDSHASSCSDHELAEENVEFDKTSESSSPIRWHQPQPDTESEPALELEPPHCRVYSVSLTTYPNAYNDITPHERQYMRNRHVGYF